MSADPAAALDAAGAGAAGDRPRAARRGAGLGQLGRRRARLAGARRRQPHRPRGAGAARGASGSPTSAPGPGFPGLVLAVALPDARVDLIESVGRKCEFMRRAIEAAGIANAERPQPALRGPAAGEGREAYDVVTARAVGRLSTLAELASPLLKPRWRPRRLEGQTRPARKSEQLANASRPLAMRPSGSSTSATAPAASTATCT